MIHTISSGTLSVSADTRGAELSSIRTTGSDGFEYLWQGDPAYWMGRAYNLFPYVGRMWEKRYYLDGQAYGMNTHGFARHAEFALVSHTDDTMVLELTDSPDTLREYPRHFSFRVTYHVEGNTLTYRYTVKNTDARPMYFGLGGHPGFNVPMRDGLAFTDYRLEFDGDASSAKCVYLTDDAHPDGTRTPYPLKDGRALPLSHDLFNRDAVVLTDVPHTVSIVTDKDSRGLRVTTPQMDYVGFWHKPKTDAPYVCIEPWVTLPSLQGVSPVLEEQEGLIHLAPGATYENTWTIEVF